MKLQFSPKAACDLEEIADYIAKDNPRRALSFIKELEKHCFKILEMPSIYAERNDLLKGLKMAVHGKYLIFFQVQREILRIERIIHGARNLTDLV